MLDEHARIGSRLGQGAFGIVVRALADGIRSTEPTTVVAVKMVKGKPVQAVTTPCCKKKWYTRFISIT